MQNFAGKFFVALKKFLEKFFGGVLVKKVDDKICKEISKKLCSIGNFKFARKELKTVSIIKVIICVMKIFLAEI